MAYFVRSHQLAPSATLVQHVFADLWVNLLESRAPMALGPPPFSVCGLLEALRTGLGAGTLEPGTISRQTALALRGLRRHRWTRIYPRWKELDKALAAVTRADDRATVTAAIGEIDDYLTFLNGSGRISSHVAFVLALPDGNYLEALQEIRDLISDLVAVGHSESFLYGWGRALLLSLDPSKPSLPLAERFEALARGGTSRRFFVAFKARTAGFLPHSDILSFGKGIFGAFATPPPWSYEPGERGVLAKIEAPDYKAAIEKALHAFNLYRDSLAFGSANRRIQVTADDFYVRCEDDATELSVSPDSVRPYEPPPLITGNAMWICDKTSPSLGPLLRQVLSWLAASRNVRGEAEFITLWLALVSLFQTDNVDRMIPALARYRLCLLIQLLAVWIADYLGKAYQLGWSAFTDELVNRLRLRDKRENRLQPILQFATIDPVALKPLAKASPLLDQRFAQLVSVCDPAMRRAVLRSEEEELRILLPWMRGVRHSVAHLGHASGTSLDLVNQHLREYVTIAFDQVTASAIKSRSDSVEAIHRTTVRDFNTLMEQTRKEACVSVLHVRQGLFHTEPHRMKYWAI